ncbi:MAG: hypothetical protein HQL34_07460 [Alphaproteobacteria bacterium]|nr:hypothetical protein [Alphaproteobacteria bacterium]
MGTPIFVQAKAEAAAEQALKLVRERGGWISTPGGRVRGCEADGVLVELHTPFAGNIAVSDLHRYQAALDGRDLPDGVSTLVVKDGWNSPALIAVLDERMRLAGVARFREGDWVHDVASAMSGRPAYVHRDDADDVVTAIATMKLLATRLWGDDARLVFLGVVMGIRSLWVHSSLLPLVLAEVEPGGLEIDVGATLTGVCVKRLEIRNPKTFENRLRRLFGGWHVYRGDRVPEVGVELDGGRERLEGEMLRLGIGDLAELEVRVAMAAH